jgi:photosynthetic reaction center cytochrome c subunit
MSNEIQKGFVIAGAFIGISAATAIGIRTFTSMGHPPVVSVQRGFRGTGLDQIYAPDKLAALAVQAKIPPILPPASASGVKAGVAYKNVRVLNDLSVGQFTRLMVSIAGWVAPKQGCAYCHNVANMADDGKYTKVVARRMMQMTQNINANWQAHVKYTGVTCYTCHGGNPVPKYLWYNNPGPEAATGLAESQTGMAHPTQLIGDTSLPYDPLTPFLEQANNIRVQSDTALPTTNMSSMKQTEWTYALMMVMSNSLGVNCDYCHNTRALRDWSQSSPARVTAWYGIRMVRDLNTHYLDPLNPIFPDYRKGVTGDSPKVYCATCHQGIYKPLYGVSMLKTFKTELGGPPKTYDMLLDPYVPASLKVPAPAPAAAPTPAPAPAPAPAAPAPH